MRGWGLQREGDLFDLAKRITSSKNTVVRDKVNLRVVLVTINSIQFTCGSSKTNKNKISFSSKIYFRGHHIFKKVWMPDVGVKLICKHDTREEAKLYVEFSVGTYRLFPSSSRELAGHLPIE